MHRSISWTLAYLLALATSQSGCMTAVAAFQPETDTTIVLTTATPDGTTHERVLSPIDVDGTLFVSANHWPRAWFRRALEVPDVTVRRGGETRRYTAVPVSEEERERIHMEAGFPALGVLLTGFAPREFLRLDPR